MLVERAVNKDIKQLDIEVAISCQLMAGVIQDDKGLISFKAKNFGIKRQPYSDQIKSLNHGVRIPKPHHRTAYPLVRDAIAKRTDGGPQSPEAIPSFPEQLSKIGYGNFRLWWQHIASELGLSNPSTSPVATSVLAAALVEGALTFAAKFAHDRNLIFSVGRLQTWRTLKMEARKAA